METTARKQQVMYDADAEQFVEYDALGEREKYTMRQIYAPLDDEVIIEYDRLREVLLEGGDKQTDLRTNSVEADEYLFDNLCKDIIGFEGEKPENWKEFIPLEEKQTGISKLLGFKIIDSGQAKAAPGRRQWGKPLTRNTVELKCRFNGEIVTCRAHFADKTPGDTASYAAIRSRVSVVEKDLDDSAIKIPSSMRKKSKLFKKLNPQVEGYVGDKVPVHHQAAFVTAFFEPKISDTEKK